MHSAILLGIRDKWEEWGEMESQRKKNAIRRRYANARAWPTFQVPCHPLSPIHLINFSTDSDSTQDKSWVELFYDV
uniref:Uncharacterized protein n=1 Tax=Moorena producens (strain JHB) TaxID=1454205 RepID=A0A1D9FU69_MOOP1